MPLNHLIKVGTGFHDMQKVEGNRVLIGSVESGFFYELDVMPDGSLKVRGLCNVGSNAGDIVIKPIATNLMLLTQI